MWDLGEEVLWGVQLDFEDFINEEKYSDEGIAFDEDGSLIEWLIRLLHRITYI